MSTQAVIWGIGRLGPALQELACGRVLLVADSSFPFLPIKDVVLSSVRPGAVFDSFRSNPDYGDICRGLELFREGGFDSIVAVGGGSAIDVAKCIKLAFMAEAGEASIVPPLVSQTVEVREEPCVPLVAIPTTAGTGSESTANAVHYYNGVKQTVAHPCILPDIALLEPSVLDTLPVYQKKCTMMDALCQGIESWWSVASTPESRGYSRNAIELIMENWRRYIFDADPEAARNIMLAANYGGRAINIAHTTAAHAMSYKLGSMFGLPHGHAVAVCLPEIWDFMNEHASAEAKAVFADIAACMGASGPECAVSLFREIMSALGLERPDGGAGREEALETLSSCVNPTRMRNNPVQLSKEVCKSLYDKILR